MTKHVGFTGTQTGMTKEQRRSVDKLLDKLNPDVVHHGECIGADADFHRLARKHGADIIGHPPDDPKKQAKLRGYSARRRPKPYMKRNDDIVAESDVVIATPKGYKEEQRGSGTWATIRRAKNANKKVRMVWPDGRVTIE